MICFKFNSHDFTVALNSEMFVTLNHSGPGFAMVLNDNCVYYHRFNIEFYINNVIFHFTFFDMYLDCTQVIVKCNTCTETMAEVLYIHDMKMLVNFAQLR